jgi:hypothetical protein
MVDQEQTKILATIMPSSKLDFETYTTDDGKWTFYHSSYPMSNTKEMDMLTDLAGCDLPEVFYGKNHFLATMPSCNVMIDVSPRLLKGTNILEKMMSLVSVKLLMTPMFLIR